MNRRDTIIIAVLLNVGLLAILFMMAINSSDEMMKDQEGSREFNVVEATQQSTFEEAPELIAINQPSTDEIDSVLQEYAANISPQEILLDEEKAEEVEETEAEPEKDKPTTSSQQSEELIKVTVKRGDALEKIARANGTTVSAIKKINKLTTERLDIGQVLKVPKKVGASPSTAKATSNKSEETKVAIVTAPEWYIVKSGDNPWKIAKQFHVKYDDILKLNNLDEEKARNLKIGDKVRVK